MGHLVYLVPHCCRAVQVKERNGCEFGVEGVNVLLRHFRCCKRLAHCECVQEEKRVYDVGCDCKRHCRCAQLAGCEKSAQYKPNREEDGKRGCAHRIGKLKLGKRQRRLPACLVRGIVQLLACGLQRKEGLRGDHPYVHLQRACKSGYLRRSGKRVRESAVGVLHRLQVAHVVCVGRACRACYGLARHGNGLRHKGGNCRVDEQGECKKPAHHCS